MTLYFFAQSVGVVAFLIGVTTFLNRNESRFKLQLAACSAIMGLHFFLMGANAAGASAVLNSIRTVISIRTRHYAIMVIFITLTLIFGGYNINHPIEVLPIFATVISTWALFRTHGLTTRCILWCATLCWVIHNTWLGSVGGMLTEGSFLLMNGFTIIRFYRMKKRGIDPFS